MKGYAILTGLTFMVMLAGESTSEAADPPPCSGLKQNRIVIQSGDTQEPLLKALGKKLRDSATPMTVLYTTTGTCTVTKNLYEAKKITKGTTLFYAPSLAENPGWTPKDAPSQCIVDAEAGETIDLGIGATFISSCDTNDPPTGIRLITGPVQGYGFAVPKGSSQRAITAEEGYFAFGFGPSGEAKPWVDPTYFAIRTVTKSTALTVAAALGIPVGKMLGQKLDKSSEVVLQLTGPLAAAEPEKSIGLVGTEIYDANRDKLNLLAFRAFKQRYAYYPDSSATSFDKRNLRDGHYFPWSPTVYIAPVDAAGVPSAPQTKQFVELVLGTTTLPDVDGLAVVIDKGLVPGCAMKVTRDFDGGNLSVYEPPEPCGCYYEGKVPNGQTSCTACGTSDSVCGGGKCRHGYCEAR